MTLADLSDWLTALRIVAGRLFKSRPSTMRDVCCVCGKHLGGRKDAPDVSHGYCFRCGVEAFRKARK